MPRQSTTINYRTILLTFVAFHFTLCGLGDLCFADGEQNQATVEQSQALEPEAALESFEVAPAVRIELVASEPEVIDPVSIRFDELGRMWVVEMRDYPLGPKEGEPPASRIRILEDRDGDGRFEASHLFADQLEFPTGVQPWRGGAFVTLAGEIAYMKDTDGDHRADVRERWFTGFAEKNTQLRANHPTLGLDRFIYVANGLRGGEVKSVFESDEKPIDIRSNDIRFDPITREFEKIAGLSQHGMSLDDFGNRFLCSNRNPLMHVVIEDRYARRNPGYALPAVVQDVAAAGENSHIYPICRSWTTSLQHAGQFTAACGATIYRGTGLPAEMYGNGFTCDPTGSLVHREILEQAGATFRSQPAREGVEFLASRDQWFRPVDLRVGPDGALYVVDMYRAVIEHPQFMPNELRNRPDLRDGDDRGRIYRLVAEDFEVKPLQVPLSKLQSDELVKMLQNPNAWQRDTAARLLLEREDSSAAEQLESLATESSLPAGRVAALRVMTGLDVLSAEVLSEALRDSHPGVRQQAIVLAERKFSDSDLLRESVLNLARDEDPRVRFQVALSLAPMKGQTEINALKQIALSGAEDGWARRAVSISAAKIAADLLEELLADLNSQNVEFSSGQQALIVEIAGLAAKSANQQQGLEMVESLFALHSGEHTEQLQQVTLTAILRIGNLKQALINLKEDDARVAALRKVFNAAMKLASNSDAETERRLEAVALLGYDSQSLSALSELAFHDKDQSVQLAAIDALGNQKSLEPWKSLVAEFSELMPKARSRVLGEMAGTAERATLLLDAIEDGRIRQASVDRVAADRLRRHRDDSIRSRANEVLASAVPQDRAKVLNDYQATLKLSSDPLRGREVFRKQCATCHSVAGVGTEVGPNIGDNYAKTREQLLTDILQPNRAIDSNFLGYLVVTDDGQTFNGLLAAESATSLTLVQEENKRLALPKSEIEEIQSTGLSLMPEGLEKNIPHQDMADLLSFLKNWRYLDGLTPYDNEPKEN